MMLSIMSDALHRTCWIRTNGSVPIVSLCWSESNHLWFKIYSKCLKVCGESRCQYLRLIYATILQFEGFWTASSLVIS